MTQQITSKDRLENGEPAGRPSRVENLDSVVIRFAGDSGDGIQLTGPAVRANQTWPARNGAARAGREV